MACDDAAVTELDHPPPHGRFVVRAVRSATGGGWDLHVEGEGMHDDPQTQVADLDDAEQEVRNYLAHKYDDDFSDALVELVTY
jgi:hypothetical protein